MINNTPVVNSGYQICTNCVMDTSDPQITFDNSGRCDFCENYYRDILPSWHPDNQGARELERIASEIKEKGKDKPYDCIIGLSGGADSSYLTHVAVNVMGLRPLILVVDTGWNLEVANKNIDCIVDSLGLDKVTEVVDWEEMKDLQVAFFRSNVPYQDTPQDHTIFAGLYNYAASHGIKYVLTGANYSTECVKPPYEWTYVNDLTLIKDIHKRFGKAPLEKLPLCGMFKYRLYYRYLKGMKVVKPLNCVPYRKEDAELILQDTYGWEKYANKHYENVFTRYFEGYYLPKKFGYDKRRAYLSSLILTGQLTREDALEELAEPAYDEALAKEDEEFIADRLGITVLDMEGFIADENKTYRDYHNSFGKIKAAIHIAKSFGIEKRNFR